MYERESMEYITLKNGVKMPQEGFGVFQISDLDQCETAVQMALKTGYRLIDTASSYKNESAVGNAIRNSGVAREDVFLTTKAYIPDMSYEGALQAFEKSCKDLGTDYLDLYLIHMPLGDYYGAWRAFEELYKAGRIKVIGVCNFSKVDLLDFSYNVEVMPMVNQIEIHPYYQRDEELKFMKQLDVQGEAWAPFSEGMHNLFENTVLQAIGKKYDKTPAQVMLRWHVQRGVVIIPKSVHIDRMKENINIWDFVLTDDDMQAIAAIDINQPQMLDLTQISEVNRVYDYLNNPVLTSL